MRTVLRALFLCLTALSSVCAHAQQESKYRESKYPVRAPDAATIRTLPLPPDAARSDRFALYRKETARTVRRTIQLKQFGTKGDRSKIGLLTSALQEEVVRLPFGSSFGFNERSFVAVSLHSLAQLKAVDALPLVEAIEQRPDVPRPEKWYAKVVRARLLAETEKTNPALLARYLKELDLTPQDLNEAPKIQNMYGLYAVSDYNPLCYELLALRELADIIYQTHNVALGEEARRFGIDFGVDGLSFEKILLARFSREKRRAMLVERISRFKVLSSFSHHLIQLLADEGLVASEAAGRRLEAILKEPDKYGRIPVAALCEVIASVPDAPEVGVVARMAQHPDPSKNEFAGRLLQNIQEGRFSLASIVY